MISRNSRMDSSSSTTRILGFIIHLAWPAPLLSPDPKGDSTSYVLGLPQPRHIIFVSASLTRKIHGEDCALSEFTLNIYQSFMTLENLMAYGQPKPRALGLRRVKRLEEPVTGLLAHALAIVF